MSEPDDPRWLAEISPELRKEVGVRPAWRARLLDEIAHTRRPAADDDFDDRDDDVVGISASSTRERRIVIGPWTAAAAAVAFATPGALRTLFEARDLSPPTSADRQVPTSLTSRSIHCIRSHARFTRILSADMPTPVAAAISS